jgi:UrcA family protein
MKTIISRRPPVVSRAAIALFAAGSLFAAASAVAAQEAAAPTIVVATAGLDLASPSGARAMLDRIQVAADRVCERPSPGVGQLEAWLELRDCEQAAVGAAVAQLNAPLVSGLVAHPGLEVAQR